MKDKNLIIFDFDFTIAKTIERISVRSPRGNYQIRDKLYKKIHPSEIQQFGIGDDELIDENSYQEFYYLNKEKSKIIKPIIPYIEYYNKDTYYILTARPQELEGEIRVFLNNNNINTQFLTYVGLKNSSYKNKIKWIDSQMQKKDYKNIILFEDNILFIKAAYAKYKQIECYYIQHLRDTIVIKYMNKE